MTRRRGQWAGGKYVIEPVARRLHSPTRVVPGGWEDVPYLRVERVPEPPKPDPGRCTECLHFDGQHQSWCGSYTPPAVVVVEKWADPSWPGPLPASVIESASRKPPVFDVPRGWEIRRGAICRALVILGETGAYRARVLVSSEGLLAIRTGDPSSSGVEFFNAYAACLFALGCDYRFDAQRWHLGSRSWSDETVEDMGGMRTLVELLTAERAVGTIDDRSADPLVGVIAFRGTERRQFGTQEEADAWLRAPRTVLGFAERVELRVPAQASVASALAPGWDIDILRNEYVHTSGALVRGIDPKRRDEAMALALGWEPCDDASGWLPASAEERYRYGVYSSLRAWRMRGEEHEASGPFPTLPHAIAWCRGEVADG